MSLDRIRDYLRYSPTTGRFYWKVRPRGCVRLGQYQQAGARRKDGYRTIQFEGRPYLAHHLAWWFVHGELPKMVDHRDGKPGNNRISNLRLCDKPTNAANMKVRRGGKSRFKGVCRNTRHGGWLVRLGTQYVGYYSDEEQAARAYDAAAVAKFGEFARTNF